MKNLYPHSISKILLICLLSLICVSRLLAAPTNVSGNVSGEWTKANSPYVITATATVPSGQTLTIDAGVTVNITSGSVQLTIQGTLSAIGTSTDSIFFFRKDGISASQIVPINFQASSQNSVLQFVKVDGLGFYYHNAQTYAILISSSSCTISNSTIQNTQGTGVGIDENASPLISKNDFAGNSNLDIVIHPNELKNITGNDSLNVGLFTTSVSIAAGDVLTANNNFYRLLTTITIPTGRNFTINPYVTVEFQTGGIQLDVQGTLTAVAPSGQNIKLLPNGGISGSQITPVLIESNSQGSVLRHVTIDGLGFYYHNDQTAALVIQSSQCTVDSCVIQNIEGTGILIAKGGKPTISNTTFYNNSNLDVDLDPDLLRKLVNNNALNIGLTNNIPMALTDTLIPNNLLYRLLTTLTIPKSRTLVMAAGVNMQFPSGGTQFIIQGTLKATGANGNYVNFARYGGLSGNQVAPVVIDTGSVNSLLQFVLIDGFGYYYHNNTTPTVILRSSSCQIVNTIIQNSQGLAVEVTNSASPQFIRSCFYNNINGAVLSVSGSPSFSTCNFSGNTSGINNTSATETIDAQNCYWGDGSGPLQKTTNPTGAGDSVSKGVNYMPFVADAFFCNDPVPVLPLTLLNFGATLSNNVVNCTWQTSNEINTNYFNIQRSNDGITFSNINTIHAAGNSSLNKSYSFVDKSPNNGINYYRLQMVDKDGKLTYSKVLPVNIIIKQPFAIYPNPVKDYLFVKIQHAIAEQVIIQIMDIQGKVVQQKSYQLQPGITTLFLNVNPLVKGSYFIVVKGQSMQKKMFVKE